MVDSPRFNPGLAEALEKKGGVSLMVLSHIDDVGDHERFVSWFDCSSLGIEQSFVPCGGYRYNLCFLCPTRVRTICCSYRALKAQSITIHCNRSV